MSKCFYFISPENIIPIHKQISDVAQFSYAALCATALHSLFETDHDGCVVCNI